MSWHWFAGICTFLSLITSTSSADLKKLTLYPETAFDFKKQTPVFLAGDALVMNAKKSSTIEFTYGEINLSGSAMLMMSKSDESLWIQNLNQEVQVTFKNGSQISIWPYFEMSLKRDMNSAQGFVIDQFRPLELKSYLIRYQKVVKPDPQSLISYGRSLKKQIEKAKAQFAESAQETSKRKVASVDEVDLEKQKNERKTRQLRRTIRQQYEEKTFGKTLKPST